MTGSERLYAVAIGLGRVLAPALGTVSHRLAAEIGARRSAASALAAWAVDRRDAARPLLWLHGASAGELLGVAPVLKELAERIDYQLAVTYFSRSGADAAGVLSPDVHGHPPYDRYAECRSAIVALRPAVIVFAGGDLWPGLTRAAEHRRVCLALVNGCVRPGSGRLRPAARALLRPSYRRLNLAGAVSKADADRLRWLGVHDTAIRLTGDAAFDLALARVDGARNHRSEWLGALGRPRPGRSLLVAGSTWPEDERALLEAVARPTLRGRVDLVLVPHQPTPIAVARLIARCRDRLRSEPELLSEHRAGSKAGRVWPDAEGEGRPLIVDSVGELPELYTVADLAYVGGGFGRSGLHSVIEPAAAGVPVLIGPSRTRREADELLARGAALRLDAGELAPGLERLLEDTELRLSMGRRGRTYVEEGAGAAAATADLLARAVNGGRDAACPALGQERTRTCSPPADRAG